MKLFAWRAAPCERPYLPTSPHISPYLDAPPLPMLKANQATQSSIVPLNTWRAAPEGVHHGRCLGRMEVQQERRGACGTLCGEKSATVFGSNLKGTVHDACFLGEPGCRSSAPGCTYRPVRGPAATAPTSAAQPPSTWTTPEPNCP